MSDKKVTLGWDGYPTILLPGGKVYPRKAEEIFHAEYYPQKITGEWPKDPKTGEPLPMAARDAFTEKTQHPLSRPGELLLALSTWLGGNAKNAENS